MEEFVRHGPEDPESIAVLRLLFRRQHPLLDEDAVVRLDALVTAAALREVVGQVGQAQEDGDDVVGRVAQDVGFLARPGVDDHHAVEAREVDCGIGCFHGIAQEEAKARGIDGIGSIPGHLVGKGERSVRREDFAEQIEPAAGRIGHVGGHLVGQIGSIGGAMRGLEEPVARAGIREVLDEFDPQDAQSECPQRPDRIRRLVPAAYGNAGRGALVQKGYPCSRAHRRGGRGGCGEDEWCDPQRGCRTVGGPHQN